MGKFGFAKIIFMSCLMIYKKFYEVKPDPNEVPIYLELNKHESDLSNKKSSWE